MTVLNLRRAEVGLAGIAPDLWRDYAAPIIDALRAHRAALHKMQLDGTCCLAAAVGKPCDEVCEAHRVLATCTDERVP